MATPADVAMWGDFLATKTFAKVPVLEMAGKDITVPYVSMCVC